MRLVKMAEGRLAVRLFDAQARGFRARSQLGESVGPMWLLSQRREAVENPALRNLLLSFEYWQGYIEKALTKRAHACIRS
jgi:hypothetical protein